jgi:hypothetical protein
MATSKSGPEFQARMNLQARSLASGVDRLVRRVVLAADEAAVTATPVDTGRARANWIVSIGSPSAEVVNPITSGQPGSGAREAANTQAALDQAGDLLFLRRPGQSVVIANNVEYITYLNDGTSRQAPHGMLPAALKAAQAVIDRAKILGRAGSAGRFRDPATGRFTRGPG